MVVEGVVYRTASDIVVERRTEYDAERINEMIERLGNMTKVLNSADPADKNDLYTQMGIHLTCNPAERLVKVEAMPTMYPTVCPRGDTPDTYMPFAASAVLVLPGRGR